MAYTKMHMLRYNIRTSPPLPLITSARGASQQDGARRAAAAAAAATATATAAEACSRASRNGRIHFLAHRRTDRRTGR